VLGKDHPVTLLAVMNMGALLRTERKFDQAEPYLREAAVGLLRVSGPNDGMTLYANGNMALLEEAQGKLDRAEHDIRDVLERARRTYGEDHPTTLLASIVESGILIRRGKLAETEQLLAPIEPVARKTLTGNNAFWFGTLLMHLGQARAGQAQHAPAEANLLEAEQILRLPHVAEEPDDLRNCIQSLVDLYTAWNKAEPGKGHDAQAAQWQQQLVSMKANVAAAKK
jgi:hypothetical protein